MLYFRTFKQQVISLAFSSVLNIYYYYISYIIYYMLPVKPSTSLVEWTYPFSKVPKNKLIFPRRLFWNKTPSILYMSSWCAQNINFAIAFYFSLPALSLRARLTGVQILTGLKTTKPKTDNILNQKAQNFSFSDV